jgi:hypothetical protein
MPARTWGGLPGAVADVELHCLRVLKALGVGLEPTT